MENMREGSVTKDSNLMLRISEMQSENEQFQKERASLIKTIEETEVMAKTKVRTLQEEIDSQAAFFTKQEKAYNKQIDFLQNQVHHLTSVDGEQMSKVQKLTQENAELYNDLTRLKTILSSKDKTKDQQKAMVQELQSQTSKIIAQNRVL